MHQNGQVVLFFVFAFMALRLPVFGPERVGMPYIRLHLPDASIEQKRVIALELIDITMRAFRLRSSDRYRISIEFLSHSRGHVWPLTRRNPNFLVEVLGHNLTEAQKRAFSREATVLLARSSPPKSENRIARLFGIKLDAPPRIDFQFGELSQAISEPFVVHTNALAA